MWTTLFHSHYIHNIDSDTGPTQTQQKEDILFVLMFCFLIKFVDSVGGITFQK